ncbi:MAG TPA: peptidase [Rhodospirillaceae bacterium]|nr:peptidase [Rhodospirillaceae bacterium]
MLFEETRRYLAKIGLPAGDLWDLPDSNKRFKDGSQFGVEIPTVNSLEALKGILEEADRQNIRINRITETIGLFKHTQKEIEEWVRLAADYGCQLVMSVGPRATYDTGATVLSPQGMVISYRLRGQEQLVRAIEDIKRGIELGVRSFIIYDEGLLWVLSNMRKDGALPPEITFKVSAHCGHCNPASLKVMESLGADSINPVRDLQLPMIAALRAAIDIPLDCHTDTPPSSGNFNRVYEAPVMVRIASPVYLKSGNSAVSAHGLKTTAENGRDMARQAAIMMEFMSRYFPEAIQLGSKAE